MRNLDIDHFAAFRRCWPQRPGPQLAVGAAPQSYLIDLNQQRAEIPGAPIAWPSASPLSPQAPLTRRQVRQIAPAPAVDPLLAYATVMAWGGRNFRNYRLSLQDPGCTNHLIPLIQKLRASTTDRGRDFATTHAACEHIPGLGISFYTKLLFFCRAAPDGYILDQWTAKSVRLLFTDCAIRLNGSGFPAPDTTPAEYLAYCDSLEWLGQQLDPLAPWSGEEVERALFDHSKGAWRAYVRDLFASGTVAQKTQPALTTPPPPPPSAQGHAFGAALAAAHRAAYDAGLPLPTGNANLGASEPIRVNCGGAAGLTWLYAIQAKSVHAQLFLAGADAAARYDQLRACLGVADHDFGDGIAGNGDIADKTRSLKITVPQGHGAAPADSSALVQQCVTAMSRLYESVGEVL